MGSVCSGLGRRLRMRYGLDRDDRNCGGVGHEVGKLLTVLGDEAVAYYVLCVVAYGCKT